MPLSLKKYKSMLNDSFWSIAALVLMNLVAQFLVYPSWSSQFGAEAYGNILYLMSFINIVSVSIGSSLNYARMASSANFKTENGEYSLLALGFCILSIPFSLGVQAFSGVEIQNNELLFFWLLQCVTMMRYYMDVDFRLSLNYKGYFLYYAFVSLGYVLGIFLCRQTGIWPLSLLPGEAFGVIYVLIGGKYLKRHPFKLSTQVKSCTKMFFFVCSSSLISTLIFNADRMLLKIFVGGTAVTIYYLASLIGKTASLITTPLNSVIIGYLVRYQGEMKRSTFGRLILIMLGLCVVLTGACVLGSMILLPFLYPDSYEMVKPFLFISSVSQVIYFATQVLTVILLRFAKQEYQLYINAVYGIVFLALGIPMTYFGGIWGFSFAILLANLIRMATCVFLGFKPLKK